MENQQDCFETSALKAPVTFERKINTELDSQLPKAYIARALVAVDKEHPCGSTNHTPNDMSVLQQHVAFFDRNKDGRVYPWETYQGFRAVGFGRIISFLGGVGMNFAFSYPTLPTWIPSLLFPVYIKNIHKAKHGSDSEVYDTEGRYDPAKFDAIFSKYAVSHGDALTFSEIIALLKGNRNAYDIFGWVAAIFEWPLLYILARDENGLLQKEAVRRMFDGSLFESLEKKYAKNMHAEHDSKSIVQCTVIDVVVPWRWLNGAYL